MIVVDVQGGALELADGTAAALPHPQCVVLLEGEAVLPPERLPSGPHPSGGVSAHLLQQSVSLSCVASALLGGAARFAEGVAALSAALLEREGLECLQGATVSASLALLLHQHGLRVGVSNVLGEVPARYHERQFDC